MAVVQGAMLGGSFLPREEFINLMKQMLMSNALEITSRLTKIQQIANTDPRGAYLLWESFSTEILGNPKTKMLAILNFMGQNSTPQTWTLTDEAETIGPDGKISIGREGSELKQIYYSQKLTQH